MSKETIFSLIRTIAIGVGAYLVGANTQIFGNVLDANLWEALVGGTITLVAAVWGIVDKTATIEATESAFKSVVALVGGLFVASGKLKAEVLVSILGVITTIMPWLLGNLSRRKLAKIQNDELTIARTEGKVTKNDRMTVVPGPNAPNPNVNPQSRR